MIFILLLLTLLSGCASRAPQDRSETIVSMQVLDRNGFSETMSAKERLKSYQKVDFLLPQPYQKVLRVFPRDRTGQSHAAITTYHQSGQIWQYLDVVSGRAHGIYREWHPGGQPKIVAEVIDGAPDVNDASQVSWLFNGTSQVWDEEGHCLATIPYDKGTLSGTSLYYHKNGQLSKKVPYVLGEIAGDLLLFDEEGHLTEKIPYVKGAEEGIAQGYRKDGSLSYSATYASGKLVAARYCDKEGNLLSEIKEGCGHQVLFDASDHLLQKTQYAGGVPHGTVETYGEEGSLLCSYRVAEGKKEGEELEYYPRFSSDAAPQPKMQVTWRQDVLQGIAKTWYPDGTLESQRELQSNKVEGLCLAWYKDGSPSFVEEYKNDLLIKGSYFQKGEKRPISRIEEGKGVATLHDGDGCLVKKTPYEKGKPQQE